ncbi:MAG: hypothetical protein OEZ18_00630 [Candidatus Bathyarchaeota archaeon]|nr:hypothetical protein [Candidatus Bathyarchaeota archaeon]
MKVQSLSSILYLLNNSNLIIDFSLLMNKKVVEKVKELRSDILIRYSSFKASMPAPSFPKTILQVFDRSDVRLFKDCRGERIRFPKIERKHIKLISCSGRVEEHVIGFCILSILK